MNALSRLLGLHQEVTGVLALLLAGLMGATAFRGFQVLGRSGPEDRRRWRSLLTWWVLFVLFAVGILLGRRAIALLMLGVALLGLREGLSLSNSGKLFPVLGLVVASLFIWGWMAPISFFLGILTFLLFFPAVAEGARRAFLPGVLEEARWTILGILLPLLGPLSVVGLTAFPTPKDASTDGWQGWLLLLVILTELNDMAQAWWGRALGSRPLAPSVSPHKSWEGLWGGMSMTVIAALLLGPVLSPVGRVPPPGFGGPGWIWAVGLGMLITSAGICGDLAASLLKRKRGVKDAGDLLPAQGGILDRFDSLALTGPVFFFVTWNLWIRPQ